MTQSAIDSAVEKAVISALDKAKIHVPQLITSSHGRSAVHGSAPVGRFNTWIAVKITDTVGSMWCAYAFTLIAVISLPAAISSGDPIIIVSWIAQTFLQLVLLPIIIVGQNVQAAASDARAEADHDTLIAIHTLSTEIHTLTARVHQINEQQTLILETLAERTKT